MAEKKSKKATETKATETKTSASIRRAAKKGERVEVYVPRGRPNEDPNLFISVNGVNYLLPRGETSLVPPEIAKEYHRSVKATDAFYNAIDERSRLAGQGV